MPIHIGNSPRNLPPSLQPGPTSPGREVYVGREIQRGVNKMIPQVRSNRCNILGNQSGFAERMLGSGLQQVSQSFFNGLSYNVQRGILEGYDRKHGTNMCQYPRRNGRYHITDRSFYNRCYNDIHDYENACDRALFGVDHARCGMFGPTACRQVWGCPCANTKEFAPVPYIACPPLHKCQTPHATKRANVEQKELQKEIETIGDAARKTPPISLQPKVGEYQIQSIEALSHALSYQNDVAQTDLDNSMEAEQVGAGAKEHAIAEYIQHLLYTEGRPASSINFDIQGQAVIINGAQIETGNPVSKEKVYEILHQKILEEGGVIDTVASTVTTYATDFNKTEKEHYYGQVIEPQMSTAGAFQKFLLEHASGDPKQKEALNLILGKNAKALNEAMHLTRKQIGERDRAAGAIMIRRTMRQAGITDERLFNFNLRENARSGAFQTGLAIATLVGIVAAPILLYKAFKKNAGMTWAGIAVVLLGVPLATGKGIFSTTKELWDNLLEIDGMEGIVGSKREKLLGAKESVDIKNKEAFAEFFLGQSTHFRDDELAALSGQAINTNPSTQAEKDLNATRILLKITAKANNTTEDKLLGIIEDGRNEKMNRLQIKEIRPGATGTDIVYQSGKVTPTNIPWRESNMAPIPTTRLVESQTFFPAGVPFELSYEALEQRSRADGAYNDANANNKIEAIVKHKIAPEAKALAVSMGLMIDETGSVVKDGISWGYDRVKKGFTNAIWPGIKLVARDGKTAVETVAGDSYVPIKEFIKDDVGGAIRIVGKDAYEGVDMIFNAATKTLDHIMVTNYAGVGPLIVKAGEVGADIVTDIYTGGVRPALGKMMEATNAVSLDVSNLAENVWDAIFDDVFESDGPVSQTNLIPYKLRSTPKAGASEFSKLLHKSLSAGKQTIVTSKDVLFATGGKYVRVSREKMLNAWNIISNKASEFGTQITTLPARTRLQLATLGGVEPPHPVISANPGLLNHLDAGEAAFVAHTLNVIHHSKRPIPKGFLDRLITWDWSFGSRNIIPQWVREIVPGGPDPDTQPTFGQQVGATYNFQAYTPLYQHNLKEWAQKKLAHEAIKNGGASTLHIQTPGNPPTMGTRTATAREKTLLAIQNLDT